MDPVLADRLRDAVALIRCWQAEDEQGAQAILAGLGDEPGAAGEVARVLAWLCADAFEAMGVEPAWLAAYQGRFGGTEWPD